MEIFYNKKLWNAVSSWKRKSGGSKISTSQMIELFDNFLTHLWFPLIFLSASHEFAVTLNEFQFPVDINYVFVINSRIIFHALEAQVLQ